MEPIIMDTPTDLSFLTLRKLKVYLIMERAAGGALFDIVKSNYSEGYRLNEKFFFWDSKSWRWYAFLYI